jgi:subfamily B ATP-binding cassette protein MsbA
MDAAAGEGEGASSLDVRKHTWREIWNMMRPILAPHRWRIVAGGLMIAVAGGAYGVMPMFSKYLFDKAIPQRSFHLALLIGGGFCCLQFVRQSFWYSAMQLLMLTQERINFALRTMAFAHLQRLCLRFHARNPSGALYKRIFEIAISTTAGFMHSVFKQLSLYVVLLISSTVCCLYLSVPMTGVIALGSLGYVAVARTLSASIYRKTRAAQEASSQISSFVMDRLRGTKTMQALAMEEEVGSEFAERLWPAQMKGLSAQKEAYRLQLLVESIGYVLTGVVMVFGAWSVFHLNLTVGELVAFMAYQATFIMVMSTIANIYGDFTAARSGMDQLLTVLETKSTVAEKSDATVPGEVRGNIEFRDVSFNYDPQLPVLKHLTLTIPAGQTVALVGRSGSGKTTVTNLLLRFYDPDGGQIFLDGMDIRELPLRPYRSLFGVVLQEPYLFNESITDNMRYAAPDATEEQIVDALKQAQAWEFIEKFPDKLNHRVGEGGGGISGGQRQRLAIARCMLLDSRFVILDEPTSALDLESEKAVQVASANLFRGRSVLIIAHRLSTLRNADKVVVLRDGGVAEMGSHAELLEKKGEFYRLAQMQQEISQIIQVAG